MKFGFEVVYWRYLLEYVIIGFDHVYIFLASHKFTNNLVDSLMSIIYTYKLTNIKFIYELVYFVYHLNKLNQGLF